MKKSFTWQLMVMLMCFLASCRSGSLSRAEVDMIMSGEAHVPMRLYTINQKSDSLLLRTPARDVKKKDIGSETIEHLSKRMLATMHDTLNTGVGIAAPQVGISLSIICVQRFDKPGEPSEVYYNPKIIEYGDSINSGQEGCLSIPNYRGTLGRSHNIEISYLDALGKLQTENINDFTAIIFQHEIDHLKGVLYYDHITGGFGSLVYIEEY
ncbi:MAG: peptide deformylase [Prolixibacteraceae bacterium]|nr:peptide deformylase [Prolixibacteraceae bacterium]